MPSTGDRAVYRKWSGLAGKRLVKVDFHGEREDTFYNAATLSLIFDDGTIVELSDSYSYFDKEAPEKTACAVPTTTLP